jgi:hypothetical protein
MYRIVLSCSGVPPSAGAGAATDITREFAEHRTWHTNVLCTWDRSKLLLSAENDYDPDGRALMDEFSDCIAAYIADGFDGEIKVESAAKHDA